MQKKWWSKIQRCNAEEMEQGVINTHTISGIFVSIVVGFAVSITVTVFEILYTYYCRRSKIKEDTFKGIKFRAAPIDNLYDLD